MSGVIYTVAIDAPSLGRAENVLARIADADLAVLVDGIAQLVENQTRERIASEKAGPDGKAWPAWGAKYARTRRQGHSLLVGEDNLLGSIQNYGAANQAVVGTNMIYAAAHQFGTDSIPERPYLGLSADNRAEVEELVTDYLGGLLA